MASGGEAAPEKHTREAIVTKRNLTLLGVSLAVATGLFWAKVLIAPNVTEAALISGVDPEQISITAGRGLPSFDDKYQRHTGVLDTLPKQ
jgi:hypothetical protein